MQEVEDFYRPYKQKRRTKATIAKEKGLEPFAQWLLAFPTEGSIEEEAHKFLSVEKEVSEKSLMFLPALKILLQNGFLMKLKAVNGLERETSKTGIIEASVKDADKVKKRFTKCIIPTRSLSIRLSPHRILAIKSWRKRRRFFGLRSNQKLNLSLSI